MIEKFWHELYNEFKEKMEVCLISVEQGKILEEQAIFNPTKITELISFSEEYAEGSFDANYKMYAVFSYENNTFLLSFYSDPYLYNVYILKANSLYNLYEILINQAKQLESSMKGSHNSFYNEQTLIKIESLAQKEHLEKSIVDNKVNQVKIKL